MTDYEHKIKICQGLRKAFAKVKHHKKLTKRVEKAIKEELPDYLVSIDTSFSSFNKINIWGKDISYNNSIGLYLDPNDWAKKFEDEIDRIDPTDQLERIEQEKTIEPAIAFIESKIADLKKRINDEQTRAYNLIKELPIPKSAKIRKDSTLWNSPTSEFAEKYPDCFT